MSYTSELRRWAKRNGHTSNRYLMGLINSGKDDATKEDAVMAFYELNKGAKSDPGDETVYLIPYENSNGSFSFINRMTGKVEVMVERLPNGLFTYYGKRKNITTYGGRGELMGLRDSMADGKYFNKG